MGRKIWNVIRGVSGEWAVFVISLGDTEFRTEATLRSAGRPLSSHKSSIPSLVLGITHLAPLLVWSDPLWSNRCHVPLGAKCGHMAYRELLG